VWFSRYRLWRNECKLLIISYFIDTANVGVACGPGCTFQVLAFLTHNPYSRCGLSTAIHNAGLRTIAVKPQKYILIRHHDFLLCFPGDYLQWHVFVFTKNVFHLINACVLKQAMSRTTALPIFPQSLKISPTHLWFYAVNTEMW
jgi:hypothetical protein